MTRGPARYANTWPKHSLTHMRDLMRGACGSHCVFEALWSLIRTGAVLFGFCLFAFAFSGVLFYNVSGSYVRVSPRPCLSTCR